MVLFKYGNSITLSVINRRINKREESKDVLEKVTLIKDININNPHRAHIEIFYDLSLKSIIKKYNCTNFVELHNAWEKVLDINELNNKFYKELSNWYFWAIQNVVFPGEPNDKELSQVHRATNVIRMLTRLLFVWFIKEKDLIPEELFDVYILKNEYLIEFEPYHNANRSNINNSIYYKAILQNLFFATLNCPRDDDGLDKRKRAFRGEGYGTHRGIDYLLRYKQYFKNPDGFLKKLNQVVPFLNGGLFECLDDKSKNIYIDGFSDNMANGEQLIVPDYLFFGTEEKTDLSNIIGESDKQYKNAAVKGLINILNSYKFTVTENTPIEVDVALDPELLGKVFENLLASYNPETKTTARKQTGSFYTPREIVNYMVDESLIAYLSQKLPIDLTHTLSKEEGYRLTSPSPLEKGSGVKVSENMGDEAADASTVSRLRHLISYSDEIHQFNDEEVKVIVDAISKMKILDPACGSGAYPMGILLKMVYILQKLDPNNKIWKEVQIKKAKKESDAAFEIEDKQARQDILLEINNAFDQNINDPDYARKLFLIENCIYGVDIQPIAIQISKLRFFISLVTDQKVNRDKPNFGIRPLPNLETKFVVANTLIGIEKGNNLFTTPQIKNLENKLKNVRSKLFSAKSKLTKNKYRDEDKVLRTQIANILKTQGLPLESANKLANWDPYDQNTPSPFFDPEWMFDIQNGFDVVIGNPPYVRIYGDNIDKSFVNYLKKNYETAFKKFDLYVIFIEKGIRLLNNNGILTYIIPDKWLSQPYGEKLRNLIINSLSINFIIDLSSIKVFEQATVSNVVLSIFKNFKKDNKFQVIKCNDTFSEINFKISEFEQSHLKINDPFNLFINQLDTSILNKIKNKSILLNEIYYVNWGCRPSPQENFVSTVKESNLYKPLIVGRNIIKYHITTNFRWVKYVKEMYNPMFKELFENQTIVFKDIIGQGDLIASIN